MWDKEKGEDEDSREYWHSQGFVERNCRICGRRVCENEAFGNKKATVDVGEAAEMSGGEADADFSQGSCDQCLGTSGLSEGEEMTGQISLGFLFWSLAPLKNRPVYVEVRPCGHLLCGDCRKDLLVRRTTCQAPQAPH
eukprot:scaffold31_cov263-Pinguiococcus_pyrenoidosus.AAC.49